MVLAVEKSEKRQSFWRGVRMSSGVKDYFWAIALPGFHRARQLRMINERKAEQREGGSDFECGRGKDGIKERGVNSGPRTVQTAYTFSFVLKHGRTQREIMSPWLLASVEFTTLSAFRHPSPFPLPIPRTLVRQPTPRTGIKTMFAWKPNALPTLSSEVRHIRLPFISFGLTVSALFVFLISRRKEFFRRISLLVDDKKVVKRGFLRISAFRKILENWDVLELSPKLEKLKSRLEFWRQGKKENLKLWKNETKLWKNQNERTKIQISVSTSKINLTLAKI